MTRSLSVVMPVHNEAANLRATIDALAAAASRSALTVELVLVDDGSTDGSVEAAQTAAAGSLPLEVLVREQEGRFKARRAGVAAATSDLVLLLDARVRLHPDSLRFLGDVLSVDTPVWNGHVVPQIEGNPFGAFGNVLVHIAWDEDRVRWRFADQLLGDQPVVDQHLTAAHEVEPTCSDQTGVAGAGADEPDRHSSDSETSESKKSRRSAYESKWARTHGRSSRSR